MTLRAIAPPAALHDIGQVPAIGTEAMPRMPVQQRFCLGEWCKMFRCDEALHGDRAQIRNDEADCRPSSLPARSGDRKTKTRSLTVASQGKCVPARSRWMQRHAARTADRRCPRFLQQHHLAADEIEAARCIRSASIQKSRIGPMLGGARDGAVDVAQLRPGARRN